MNFPPFDDPFGRKKLGERPPVKAPADLDWDAIEAKIRQRKNPASTGEPRYDSSGYLARMREEDPWPEKNSEPTPTLELSECQIVTPSNELDIGRDFEAQCKAVMVNNCTPSNVKVAFEFRCKIVVDGEIQEDVVQDAVFGYLDLDSRDQTVKINGTLPEPPQYPASGSKVTYILAAAHPEAREKADSAPIEVVIHYPGDDDSDSEHEGERTVTISTKDGAPLIGAEYVLCGDGQKIKSGRLDDDSTMTYGATAGVKYSIYMVNAGPIEIEEAEAEDD